VGSRSVTCAMNREDAAAASCAAAAAPSTIRAPGIYILYGALGGGPPQSPHQIGF